MQKNRYTNQATTIEEEEKIATLLGHGLPHVHTVLALVFCLFVCLFLFCFCFCFFALLFFAFFFLEKHFDIFFFPGHLMTMQVKNITLGKEF